MSDSRDILVSNDFTDMEYRKNNILSILGMSPDNLNKFSEKLEQYKYISSMLLLNVGSYIKFKNNNGNIYQLNIMHNVIFQKLTDQEKVIMDAVRFIKK